MDFLFSLVYDNTCERVFTNYKLGGSNNGRKVCLLI
jgi:hypothetical protein